MLYLHYLLVFGLKISIVSSAIFPWHLHLKFGEKTPPFNGSFLLRFEAEQLKVSKNLLFKSEDQMFDFSAKSGQSERRDLQMSFSDLDGIRVQLLFLSFSCQKGAKRLQKLHLSLLELTSAKERQIYVAENLSPRVIEVLGKCGTEPNIWDEMTLVQTWHAFPTTMCYFGSKFYKSNVQIESGCRQRCLCSEGTVACTDFCVDEEIRTDQTTACRKFNILGECCPKTECLRNTTNYLKVVKCENPRLSAEPKQVPSGIPHWSYFVVVDRYAKDGGKWCGATLIDESWLLVPAHCVFVADGSENHFIIVRPEVIDVYKPTLDGSLSLIGESPGRKISEVQVHPEFRRPTGDVFSSTDFALLKLDTAVNTDEQNQPINLPWINECFEYFDNPSCQLAVTVHTNDSSRLLFDNLPAAGILTPNGQCQKSRSMFCYDLATSNRFGANSVGVDGSGATAKRQGAHVLVGMSLSASEGWRKPTGLKDKSKGVASVADVLAICQVLPWLASALT